MTEPTSHLFPRIVNPHALPLDISRMFDGDDVKFRFDLTPYIRDLTEQLHSLEEAAVVAVLRSKGWTVSRPNSERNEQPRATTTQIRDAVVMVWRDVTGMSIEEADERFDSWLADEVRGESANRQVQAIRQILEPEWLRGKILPQYVGSVDAARIQSIQSVLADDLGRNRGNPPGSITLPDAESLSDSGAELVKQWWKLTTARVEWDYLRDVAVSMAHWIERTSEVLTAPFAIDEEALSQVLSEAFELWSSAYDPQTDIAAAAATAVNERMNEWLRPFGAHVAICPTCHENLGHHPDRDGYTAEWWADKAIGEHLAEHHD